MQDLPILHTAILQGIPFWQTNDGQLVAFLHLSIGNSELFLIRNPNQFIFAVAFADIDA